jgi:hypothetical protein
LALLTTGAVLGGLCGAVFVDEAFSELLKEKFTTTKWDKMSDDSRARLLHDEWEHGIKPQFDGRERTWTINIPWECLDKKSLTSMNAWPKVALTANDVKGVFDPVVDKIWSMIQDQITAIKAKNAEDPKVLPHPLSVFNQILMI